jgi:hypothetical protein
MIPPVMIRQKEDDSCGCKEEEWETNFGLVFLHVHSDGYIIDGCLCYGEDEHQVDFDGPIPNREAALDLAQSMYAKLLTGENRNVV